MNDPKSNEDTCGFVCPSCSSEMRLSELSAEKAIIEAFNRGHEPVSIACPECQRSHLFQSRDLKLFLPDGEVLPFHPISIAA